MLNHQWSKGESENIKYSPLAVTVNFPSFFQKNQNIASPNLLVAHFKKNFSNSPFKEPKPSSNCGTNGEAVLERLVE